MSCTTTSASACVEVKQEEQEDPIVKILKVKKIPLTVREKTRRYYLKHQEKIKEKYRLKYYEKRDDIKRKREENREEINAKQRIIGRKRYAPIKEANKLNNEFFRLSNIEF